VSDAAELHVLHEGYLSSGGNQRVGSTVSLIRDGDVLVVIDPGLARGREAILGPLSALGIRPEQVTDVVISHHHPDHTVNVALFPAARLHDHWAWYRDDLWVSRPAEGFELSPRIRLLETPGHSAEDVSTAVDTTEGLVVATHLWWTASVPIEDPYAPDPAVLHEQRARVLALPNLARVVPGHGPAFVPNDQTPR
jgi:glyoxylase-like metal-dependent hydrolase (beta-lactamase superfamily II)